MSEQYPGGFITKVPPTPSGPYSTDSATGLWNLSQQAAYKQQGLWPTQGNLPPDAFVEGVFSSYVWAGTGNQLSINNGINLLDNGGMVWIKNRTNVNSNQLFDTVRGFTYSGSQPMGNNLQSNTTDAQAYIGYGFSAFNSNGFRVGYNDGAGTNVADANVNGSGNDYVAWAFQEKAKFFDIVGSLTADGSGNLPTFNHSLASVPGCVFLKATNSGSNWVVYHRSLSGSGENQYLQLNSTNAATNATGFAVATSTTFQVAAGSALVPGATYIAYLFAHNAGGFGLSGTENIISCGSYVGNGSTDGPTVTLGYEPQWLLVKGTTSAVPWWIVDTIRGMPVGSNDWRLRPNTNDADNNGDPFFAPTATGFKLETLSSNVNASGQTYIYVAIRRGPMAVPTDANAVFDVGTRSGSASVAKTNSDILTDLAVIKRYTSAAEYWAWTPRLVGNQTLQSNSGDGELSGAMAASTWDTMTGAFCAASNGATNTSTLVDYSFKRAPGYHDVVCYSGSGSSPQVLSHNLTVVPEMMIVKNRGASTNWYVYTAAVGNTAALYLDGVGTPTTSAVFWNNTSPTSTQFTVGSFPSGAGNYVAYLFATLPNVSKVGSYTATGTLTTINCGFTGGARFVLIRKTSGAGSWFIWDSARGMVSGTDPSLRLNVTDAEVNGNSIYSIATGFQLQVSPAEGINTNGDTYIFLAIA